MTLQAPDGLPIVSLENFEEIDFELDCRDEEGRLDLKWGSGDAFEVARSQWGYINRDEEGRFLVIANQDGCGESGQRQGYVLVLSSWLFFLYSWWWRVRAMLLTFGDRISNITYDTAQKTTSLSANITPWSEVAGSYTLEFGHTIPTAPADRLKRSILGSIENAGEAALNATEGDLDNIDNDISNAAKGDWDKGWNKSLSISAGTPNQRENIWTDTELVP